jgi:uncharacterized protein
MAHDMEGGVVTGVHVDASKAWIQTYSGGIFHILDPKQDEINIKDIGHSLAMQCRFTGHVRHFYSIAEHCVLGSFIVPKKHALRFLMHDASEAYIADINRPLKHFTGVGAAYLPVEENIQDAIHEKFHLQLLDHDCAVPEPACIKEADNAMLYAEKEQLLPPMDWETKWGADTKAADVKILCWAPEVAEVEFLHRYYELAGKL